VQKTGFGCGKRRCDIVDEKALVDKLKTGRILPVYYLENAILTLHIVGRSSKNRRYEHRQYVVDKIYIIFTKLMCLNMKLQRK